LTKNNSVNSKLDTRVFEIKFLIYPFGCLEIPTRKCLCQRTVPAHLRGPGSSERRDLECGQKKRLA